MFSSSMQLGHAAALTLHRALHLPQVVIATGTLAFGINMPCRTVAFAGDSLFLSALQFRQVRPLCCESVCRAIGRHRVMWFVQPPPGRLPPADLCR